MGTDLTSFFQYGVGVERAGENICPSACLEWEYSMTNTTLLPKLVNRFDCHAALPSSHWNQPKIQNKSSQPNVYRSRLPPGGHLEDALCNSPEVLHGKAGGP
eukprot:scaffold678981_cov39-Prasinocladus_malaysianus.AAC.1